MVGGEPCQLPARSEQRAVEREAARANGHEHQRNAQVNSRQLVGAGATGGHERIAAQGGVVPHRHRHGGRDPQRRKRNKQPEDPGQAAAELVNRMGGRYLLMGPGAELLEGDFGNGASMVISEWPDKAAAKAFWDSEEYAEIKKLREGIADCQVLLIEAPAIQRD